MKWLLLKIIIFYQTSISPFYPARCRYYPSCSEYARLSLQQFSFIEAFYKILVRLLKCNPLSRGGVDLP